MHKDVSYVMKTFESLYYGSFNVQVFYSKNVHRNSLRLGERQRMCHHYYLCFVGCLTDEPPLGGTEVLSNHNSPERTAEIDRTFRFNTRIGLDAYISFEQFNI